MNFLPMTMRMKVIKPPARRTNLWLPLFIIIPVAGIIAFALFLLMLPFLLIAAVVLWRRGLWRPIVFFWPAVITVLFALRGFEVDVSKNDEQVFLSFK